MLTLEFLACLPFGHFLANILRQLQQQCVAGFSYFFTDSGSLWLRKVEKIYV